MEKSFIEGGGDILLVFTALTKEDILRNSKPSQDVQEEEDSLEQDILKRPSDLEIPSDEKD